jgi:hypothetical protein
MELSSAPSSPVAASLMDLASEPSSPSPLSPAPLPTATQPVETSNKPTSFSPPGLCASPSPQLQPVVNRTDVPPMDLSVKHHSSPELSPAPLPEKSWSVTPVRPIHVAPEQTNADIVQSLSDIHTIPSASSAGTVVESPYVPAASISPIYGEKSGTASSSVDFSPAYVPKRKIVPNPFVSGGLLTDFVSSSATKQTIDASREEHIDLSAAATQSKVRSTV